MVFTQIRGTLTGVVAAAALTGAALPAAAQESTNQVAANTAWSVFEDKNPKECWAVSAPT